MASPSIEEQKEWIENNIIKFDPIYWSPFLPVQPFADQIAQYIGVLPNINDFMNIDDKHKHIYDCIQNDRTFATQFRIKGYGKIDNALDILSKQYDTDTIETKENQALVTGIDIEKLSKAYKYR